MDITEVIAIAKTLRPGSAIKFIGLHINDFDFRHHQYEVQFATPFGVMPYTGSSWEEALRSAGWKG